MNGYLSKNRKIYSAHSTRGQTTIATPAYTHTTDAYIAITPILTPCPNARAHPSLEPESYPSPEPRAKPYTEPKADPYPEPRDVSRHACVMSEVDVYDRT